MPRWANGGTDTGGEGGGGNSKPEIKSVLRINIYLMMHSTNQHGDGDCSSPVVMLEMGRGKIPLWD